MYIFLLLKSSYNCVRVNTNCVLNFFLQLIRKNRFQLFKIIGKTVAYNWLCRLQRIFDLLTVN